MDLVQVEEPAGQHLIRNAFRDGRVERKRDYLRIMAFGHESFFQFDGMQFRSAEDKRNLHRSDNYSHGKAGPVRMCCLNIMRLLSALSFANCPQLRELITYIRKICMKEFYFALHFL